MRVITVNVNPIAPDAFTYEAALDGDFEPGMPVGVGRTREEAIQELRDVLEARGEQLDECYEEESEQNRSLSNETE